ncbi:MAG: TPM domain-containing protein [Saprospiraceae bacterium]
MVRKVLTEDNMAGRIVRNTMIPYFRRERYYEGIDAGLDDIIRVMSGEFTVEKSEPMSKKKAIVVLL